MVRIERSVIIKRPIEEVFAFVTDIDNFPKWIPSVVESEKISRGPIGVGTTEHEVVFRGYFFLKGENNSVVTEYQLNKKIAWRTTSSFFPPWDSTYNFESVEGGTNVTYVLQWEPNGLYKLLNPFVVFIITMFDVKIPLCKLKNLLESEGDSFS